jgi:hypothetical protein
MTGETFVKPCLLTAANTVLGAKNQKSYHKICSLITQWSVAEDIKRQVVCVCVWGGVGILFFFAIQCDDTTVKAQRCQLFTYSWFVDDGAAKEMFFSKVLETTQRLLTFWQQLLTFSWKFSWEKLVSVCTDSAPAMLGSHSGVMTLVKEKNSAITRTHCRQALAAKTLPHDLCNVLKLAIKVVNFVSKYKAFCSSLCRFGTWSWNSLASCWSLLAVERKYAESTLWTQAWSGNFSAVRKKKNYMILS